MQQGLYCWLLLLARDHARHSEPFNIVGSHRLPHFDKELFAVSIGCYEPNATQNSRYLSYRWPICLGPRFATLEFGWSSNYGCKTKERLAIVEAIWIALLSCVRNVIPCGKYPETLMADAISSWYRRDSICAEAQPISIPHGPYWSR